MNEHEIELTKVQIAKLRQVYIAKAKKHMNVQDMHQELADLTVPMVLSKSQIADIVNAAYHPWNNPNKRWGEITNAFFDGWVTDKGR